MKILAVMALIALFLLVRNDSSDLSDPWGD